MPIKGPTNEFSRKCSLVLPAAVFRYLKQLPVGSIEVNDGEFTNENLRICNMISKKSPDQTVTICVSVFQSIDSCLSYLNKNLGCHLAHILALSRHGTDRGFASPNPQNTLRLFLDQGESELLSYN